MFCTNDKETINFERIFMVEYFIFELGCSNSEKSAKMISKQQAYTHVVKSTWNQALSRRRKQGYGRKAVVEHRLICIVLSLCKHVCKSVCEVHPGIDRYTLLARSCKRWWPDFVTFTACKKSRFGLKRGKKVQCVLNRCKALFERKNILGLGAL